MQCNRRELRMPHLVTEAVYAGSGGPGTIFTSGGLQGGHALFLESGLGEALAGIGLAVGWKRRFAQGNSGPFCLQSFESNAFDLMHVMDAFDMERPNVMGGSIGASTSLTFAYWMPRRVNKLVLLDPSCIRAVEHAESLRALVRRCRELVRDRGVAGALESEGFAYQLSPDRDDLAGGRIGDMDAEEFMTLLQETYRRMGTGRLPVLGMPASMLAGIDHPALVVPGNDAVHPLEVGRQLARLLPNARLCEAERPPDALGPAVLEAIAEFLTE